MSVKKVSLVVSWNFIEIKFACNRYFTYGNRKGSQLRAAN